MSTTTNLTIYQGEDRTITLQIVKKGQQAYFDLTGATEIKAKLPKGDGTALEKKLSTGGVSVTDAKAGKLAVALTDSDTALLNAAEKQDFELVISIGSTDRIVQFLKALTVKAQVFS